MEREVLRYEILNLGIKISEIKNFEKKIDIILEQYYGREIKFNPYLNSKNKLIRLIIEGDFPTVSEWNAIAREEGYLSHLSLEYITGKNWNGLKSILLREIKDILME